MFGKFAEMWALFQLFLGLVPLLKNVVVALEVPGHGEEKAAAVIQLVREVWLLVPDDLKPKIGLDKVESFVNKALGIIVRLLNTAGVFPTSKPV